MDDTPKHIPTTNLWEKAVSGAKKILVQKGRTHVLRNDTLLAQKKEAYFAHKNPGGKNYRLINDQNS